MLLLHIPTVTIVLLVITAVVIGITIALSLASISALFCCSEQDEQVAKVAQTVSMLIIDKKKMRVNQAGLPDEMINAMPWYAKRSKMPIVKAKVGPKVMTFICDYEVFDSVPTKREVKATVSGLYITGVKGLHGKNNGAAEQPKGLRARLARKLKSAQK